MPAGTAPSDLAAGAAGGRRRLRRSCRRRRPTLAADTATLDQASASLAADRAKLTVDCAGDNAGAERRELVRRARRRRLRLDAVRERRAVRGDRRAERRRRRRRRSRRDQQAVSSARPGSPARRARLAPGGVVGDGLRPELDLHARCPRSGRSSAAGRRLYAISGQPVVLLYGSVAAVAGVLPGMSPGRDVARAEREPRRARLRHGPRGDAFTAATAAAIERVPGRARPQPRPGELLLGSVVFEPGAVRVTSVTPTLGATVQPGPVLAITSTGAAGHDRSSTPRSSREVKVGDPVTITLPDNRTTPGQVSYVGTVATTRRAPTRAAAAAARARRRSRSTSPRPTRPRPGTSTRRRSTSRSRPRSVRNALVVPGERAARARRRRLRGRGGRRRRRPPPRRRSSSGLFDDADGLVQVTGTRPRCRAARRGAERMSVDRTVDAA